VPIKTGKLAIPAPTAPSPCKTANVLPAYMAPPTAAAWIPAAIDPAAIPAVVNPIA